MLVLQPLPGWISLGGLFQHAATKSAAARDFCFSSPTHNLLIATGAESVGPGRSLILCNCRCPREIYRFRQSNRSCRCTAQLIHPPTPAVGTPTHPPTPQHHHAQQSRCPAGPEGPAWGLKQPQDAGCKAPEACQAPGAAGVYKSALLLPSPLPAASDFADARCRPLPRS